MDTEEAQVTLSVEVQQPDQEPSKQEPGSRSTPVEQSAPPEQNLERTQSSQSITDIIRRRFENKITESKAAGHLTVPNAELLIVPATTSDSERPQSEIVTSKERLVYTQNEKTDARPAGEQSNEGVHPNAVKDPQNFCVVCGKRVYQLEKIAAHKGVYHKTCFRCGVCEKILSPGNFSVLDGHLFCKPHLMQQFKTRGKYETTAAFKAREAGAARVNGTEGAM